MPSAGACGKVRIKTHDLQSARCARVGRQVPRTVALHAGNEPVVRRLHELTAAYRECECHKVVHHRGAVIHSYNLCKRKLIKNERVWLVVQTAIKNEMKGRKMGDRLRTESEGHDNISQSAVVAKECHRQRYPRLPDHVSGRLSNVRKLMSVVCGDASPGPSWENCYVD